MTLAVSLAPFVARKKLESEEAYWSALEKIFKVFALIGWMVCIPTIALSAYAVDLLYGNEYKDGAAVLAIYGITNLFINMGVAQSLWLINEKRAIISLFKTLAGAMTCIIGNLILLPKLGITGAAIVAVTSQLVSAVLMNIFFSKRILIVQIKSLASPKFKI